MVRVFLTGSPLFPLSQLFNSETTTPVATLMSEIKTCEPAPSLLLLLPLCLVLTRGFFYFMSISSLLPSLEPWKPHVTEAFQFRF